MNNIYYSRLFTTFIKSSTPVNEATIFKDYYSQIKVINNGFTRLFTG